MACCDELERLIDLEMVRRAPVHQLSDGRILNDIDTEYFFRFERSYVGMNYCPFCGRVLSRGLWNAEKKK